MLPLMYGYSPSSLATLLCFTSGSPTSPQGASETYSYPRVLCSLPGAPGAPPAPLWCLLSASSSCTSTQLVPPGWAPSSLALLRRVLCRVPGVALLSRSLCRSSLRSRPLDRVFSRFVAFLWSLVSADFPVFRVLRGFSCAKVTSHESSTLSSHQMSCWRAASRVSTSRLTGRIPTPVGVGILQAHF